MAINTINSLDFGSNTYVFTTPFATCSTSASTATKVATTTPGSNFSLETGARVIVKFLNGNNASSPKLNVNETGAKSIFCTNSNDQCFVGMTTNEVYEFVYDGTYFQLIGSHSVAKWASYYIKFNNGVQICWGTFTAAANIYSQTPSYSVYFKQGTYPTVFLQVMDTPCNFGYTNTVSVESTTNTNFTFRKEFSESKKVAYLAYGLWK